MDTSDHNPRDYRSRGRAFSTEVDELIARIDKLEANIKRVREMIARRDKKIADLQKRVR